ncbi:hypothetical protein QUF54_01705 [Candidatus Marithioploca araucensis]|uniref:Uncharacterized protein n=1 Tax=Candidatus Marithioploca araucensis TaxID=70273 RepID=A0ABT7VQV9_9GAMM|nr:hypothetical protein [Candidatus Marithioploca araucensis]
MTDYFKQLWADLVQLCHAEPRVLATWLDKDKEKIQSCLIWLILGSSLYGASIGLWRAPLQSFYVAIKFPLLIILTTLGNAIINGMLAQLLGAKISFRQSFLAIIMSFTLIAIILGAFTPLALFLLYNLPFSSLWTNISRPSSCFKQAGCYSKLQQSRLVHKR